MRALVSTTSLDKLCALCVALAMPLVLLSCGGGKLAVKTALEPKPAVSVQFQGPTGGVWGTLSMPSPQPAGPSPRIPVPAAFSALADSVAEGFKEGWGLENVTVVDPSAAAPTSGLLVEVITYGGYAYSDAKWTLSMTTVIVIKDLDQGKRLNGLMGDDVCAISSQPTSVPGVTPNSNSDKVHEEAMVPDQVLLDALKAATKKGVIDYLAEVKQAA